jgi:hypothetical protein
MNFPKIENLNNLEQTKFALCRNKDRPEDKILLGENTKIVYEAKSKLKNNLSDYVIGIFSKKKRTMKFVDLEGIFPVNQKIRRIEEHAQRQEEEEQHKLFNEIAEGNNIEKPEKKNDYVENKLQLISDFGTAKAKKASQGIKAHRVDENNISSMNAVKRMLEDTAVKQSEDVRMNDDQRRENRIATWKEILPEFNIDAEEAKDIFSFESSIVTKLIS